MASNWRRFALLTQDNIVLLPTPLSAHVRGYRDLFRRVHADEEFCSIAFGDGFKPVVWTDEEVKEFLLEHDAAICWGNRGMGDFAVGKTPEGSDAEAVLQQLKGREVDMLAPKGVENAQRESFRIIEEEGELDALLKPSIMDSATWLGYTCVRDASTTSLWDLYEKQKSSSDDKTDTKEALPPWQEMIEVRYGLSSEARGRGIGTRVTEVVMRWAVVEHGVRRFIAETEKRNDKSAKLLQRMGFVKSDTNYFEEEEEDEWEKWADV